MVSHELESSNLTIAAKFLSHVKQACLSYFNNQKERYMQRVLLIILMMQIETLGSCKTQ